MKYVVLILSLLASPAAAYDICDEAWFLRNLIFDRAGYCFGSALGRSVFDNSDCRTKDPALSDRERETVSKIRDFEGWMECKVNTSGSTLDVPHLPLLRSLLDMPIPTDTGSGCIGWTGAPFELLAGYDYDSSVVAIVHPGMTIIWDYDWVAPEGWEFVSVNLDGEMVGLGWTPPIDIRNCTSLAG